MTDLSSMKGMEVKQFRNNAYLKAEYIRTAKNPTPLNTVVVKNDQDDLEPGEVRTDPKRYNAFNGVPIYYIVRTPQCVKGWKLGVKEDGGARLREYWRHYGDAKGFAIMRVITFTKRLATMTGEKGREHVKAYQKFETLVKRYLTKTMRVTPIRGTEWFARLKDIQEATDAVIAEFTYRPEPRRVSVRQKQTYRKPLVKQEVIVQFKENEPGKHGELPTKKLKGYTGTVEVSFKNQMYDVRWAVDNTMTRLRLGRNNFNKIVESGWRFAQWPPKKVSTSKK